MSLQQINYKQIRGATVNASTYGMLPSASAATNKAALLEAVAALGARGGEVFIPRGTYSIAPEITWTTSNVTISGDGNAYGYGQARDTAGTNLVFTAGTYGFDLSTYNDALYTEFKDLQINGNSVLATGINSTGQNLFERVDFRFCTSYGLRLVPPTNETHIDKCAFLNNGVAGLIMSATGGVSYSTPISIKRSNFRENGIGLYFEEGNLVSISDCVIESNTGYGLHILSDSAGHFDFTNVWFENNGEGTVDYQFKLEGSTAISRGPAFINFNQCVFNPGSATQKWGWIQNVFFANFNNYQAGGTPVDGWRLDALAYYVVFNSYSASHGLPTQAQLLTGNRCFKEYPLTNGVGGQRIEAFQTADGYAIAATANEGSGAYYSSMLTGYADITASASIVITLNIPLGAVILGTQLRVDTALTVGELWDASFSGGSSKAIAVAEPVAINTKVNVPFYGLNTSGTLSAPALVNPVTTALTQITITKNGGGAFTALGRIRAYVYYSDFIALPSV